jgi:hypothetical protein
MQSRILAGALLLVGAFSVSTLATGSATRQWSIVNFPDPVQVADQRVMGPVVIVHDDVKMAEGEPCTTFYRFDPKRGPQEALVSFHCTPVQRGVVAKTTFTVVPGADGCKRLVEYQIAGEGEAHGILSR